ncbi:MAG: acyl-CoA thioesterase [Mycobacterium sp.]|nr:acyl-CoA thioesterase [Mycobacterium sp.]
MTHPFDVALALDSSDGSARGRTTPDFANMVGPFGGLTAAAFIRAIEQHPQRLGVPVSLTVNFAAPITDGEFVIGLRPVRTNRTNQHWTAELIQSTGDGPEIKTTATAVFGLRRSTWSDTEPAPPAAPPPEDAVAQDISSFVTWTRNYEMRFVSGAMPGEGAGENPDSTSTLWVRPQPERALDFPALTALCDVFYPRVFLRRGQFIPAGTISFTVYFHAEPDDLSRQGADWLLATSRAQRFSSGFFDQTAQLWGRDGTLLAVTHQIVYFKN